MNRAGMTTCWGMMVVLAIVGVDVVRAAPRAGDEDPYFPDLVFDANKENHNFVVDWYSKHLNAMKEPSLWKLSERDRAATVYRFLWLPTFHRPVSVRLVRTGEGATLYAVLLDGRGGYDPGKVIASRSTKIVGKPWEDFQRLLDQSEVWEMPTKDPDLGGTDGDQLIFEAVRMGKYHVVDRWTPEGDDDYAKLCRYMLTLSGLDVMKTWDEYRR